MGLPARNEVEALVELDEQAGNLRGIVLEIGVDRDDDLAAGLTETRRQRRGLPEVAAQPDNANVLVLIVQARQRCEGPVHGAVVDKDGLPFLPQWLESSLELVVEEGDRALLIVQRDDDRDHGTKAARAVARRRCAQAGACPRRDGRHPRRGGRARRGRSSGDPGRSPAPLGSDRSQSAP